MGEPCAQKLLSASQRATSSSPWSFAEGWQELSAVWPAFWQCSSCLEDSTFWGTPSNIHWLRKPRESSPQRSASPSRPSSSISFSSLASASAREPLASGARDSRKVSLLENLPVVQLVPRRDECQRPHTHLVFVGRTAPHPRVFPKRPKQRQARAPHIRKFFDQTRQRPFVESAAAHVVVLLESLHRRLVAPRNPQCPVRKNSLGIADVAQHFLHRPLVCRIAKISVSLAAPRKELHSLHALRFQRARRVSSRNQRNVLLVVSCVLPSFRPSQFHFASPWRSILRLPALQTCFCDAPLSNPQPMWLRFQSGTLSSLFSFR